MSEIVKLAREVIDKYGADADKPSVHLAKALLDCARELDAWRNCFICVECGRGKADEDGCCTTCGNDALIFIDGRLVTDTYLSAWKADGRRTGERETAERIATWLLNEVMCPTVAVSMIEQWAADIRAGKWRP